MATLYVAPTKNYFSTTLNGSITDTTTTITLNSTTGLQAPGYLVIDREDGSGNATPDKREVISFTGISGNDITGVTRGTDGSTARPHNDGALVEAVPTVGMWNSLATIVDTAIDNNGLLRAIVSPVSISRLELNQMALSSVASLTRGEFDELALSSVASIAEGHIPTTYVSTMTLTTLLNASGASVVGDFGAGNAQGGSATGGGNSVSSTTPIAATSAVSIALDGTRHVFITGTVQLYANAGTYTDGYVQIRKGGVGVGTKFREDLPTGNQRKSISVSYLDLNATGNVSYDIAFASNGTIIYNESARIDVIAVTAK